MAKSIRNLSSAVLKLDRENKELRLKLRQVAISVAAIQAGNIDALLVGAKKDAKVYTEKTSDKIYRILIEKMHEGAIILNHHGTILYCNSFFAEMVNFPLQKVIGSKFKDYIDSSSIVQFDASIKNGWTASVQSEIIIRSFNGKVIPVLMSANTLSHSKNLTLSIILTDLTIRNRNREELMLEKDKLEQVNLELENTNKDLTVFTYISSHDLQEPLRKIQNFVTMITEDEETTLSESSKIHFERCKVSANRMQALIEDLLLYSRAKNIDRKFEKINLNLIVEDVKRDNAELIEKKNAVITTHLGEAFILRFQFGQLMQNLIANSLKFSRRHSPPRIRIESNIVGGSTLRDQKPDLYKLLDESDRWSGKISSKTKYCHIIYTDNGIGFDPQYNERIFEVFQRLNNRDTYEGTGMGLAICKRIIENHHGIITASGRLEKGARFDIYIPL